METIYCDTGSFSISHERKAVSRFSPNLKILWLHARRCFNVFCVDIPGKSNTIRTILIHFMMIWGVLDGFRRRETVFGADLESLLNTLLNPKVTDFNSGCITAAVSVYYSL